MRLLFSDETYRHRRRLETSALAAANEIRKYVCFEEDELYQFLRRLHSNRVIHQLHTCGGGHMPPIASTTLPQVNCGEEETAPPARVAL